MTAAIEPGDFAYHHPTGDYLGIVTAVDDMRVYFDGPRTRDGASVPFAGHHQVTKGGPPDVSCPDCAVKAGTPHENGCDVARCLWSGEQLLQCEGTFAPTVRQLRADGHTEMADGLAHYLSIDDEDHDCGSDVWTGEWPGSSNAARLGKFVYWGPDFGEKGWQRCDGFHLAAHPDLNFLNGMNCNWNQTTHEWDLRTEGEN